MIMEAKRARKAQLGSIAGTTYVSYSARRDIIEMIKSHAIPVDQLPTSRKAFSKAVREEVNTDTLYGPVFTTLQLPRAGGGGQWTWKG